MHSNSIDAYNQMVETIKGKRREVLDVIIRNKHVTRQDIARIMGKPINEVTGRVKELLEIGAIDEVGVDTSSGRSRAILGLSFETAQLDLQL
jgi:chromosome segregation and condensation protein ScpB